MIVLGIDTATSTASVGLLDGDRRIAERQLPGARSLAATVVPLIQQVVADANREVGAIDLVAVSTGPGSFTGLRIGLSVGKALALSLGRPVVGVPSLEVLARVALGCGAGRSPDGYAEAEERPSFRRRSAICAVLDARRGEVYAALFRSGGNSRLERLTTDFAAAPPFLAAELGRLGADHTCVMVGDGAELYRPVWEQEIPAERLEFLSFAQFGPSGCVVAEIGRTRFAERGGDSVELLVPRYCRVSEAERKAARAESSTEDSQRSAARPPISVKRKIDRLEGLG